MRPVVALVGRPNVGKSTLFNRIAGERLAVVDETPGTTRDRLVAEAEWQGLTFNIVDTGGIDPTKSRGDEPLSINSREYVDQIRAHAEMAAREADAVLFVVDVESGVTSADHEVAEILRKSVGGEEGPRVFLVANKADNAERRSAALEFFELGMDEPYAVSALHGSGVGDLLDGLVDSLARPAEQAETVEDDVRIAIVGRPNVGKSSLLNRILGEERAIVSPIPGTTRDAVDTRLVYQEQSVTLIDTAGIRRRGRIDVGVEKYSVIRALKAIERSNVAILVIDAAEGVTAQDAHIGGMVIDKFRSVILTLNKWDLIEKDEHTMGEYAARARAALKFLDYVPVLFISALTGQRVPQVLPLALEVRDARRMRITTGELNRIIQDALDAHAPPSRAGRRLKIFYSAQVQTEPPTFVFHVNDPKLVHFSYRRYLENQIREAHPFLGTPIRMAFRPRNQQRRGRS